VELYLHSRNTPSWRGAQLKHRGNFTFTFTVSPLKHKKMYRTTILPVVLFRGENLVYHVKETTN
jgi:hypothetical protein